jgi:hypothetical protein
MWYQAHWLTLIGISWGLNSIRDDPNEEQEVVGLIAGTRVLITAYTSLMSLGPPSVSRLINSRVITCSWRTSPTRLPRGLLGQAILVFGVLRRCSFWSVAGSSPSPYIWIRRFRCHHTLNILFHFLNQKDKCSLLSAKLWTTRLKLS